MDLPTFRTSVSIGVLSMARSIALQSKQFQDPISGGGVYRIVGSQPDIVEYRTFDQIIDYVERLFPEGTVGLAGCERGTKRKHDQ